KTEIIQPIVKSRLRVPNTKEKHAAYSKMI
ncbi:unnamed protein product, partial [marine sediment metagenome]